MSALQAIKPHEKDLGGGFVVRRLLPSALRQAVGPFLFFDHFGPVSVRPDDQFDVRPHPHIGLATVTYLFEGAILHRDNLGFEQRIEPGAINWMTAGRGIVHSERRPADLAGQHYTNHGLQLWVALPAALEQVAPSFVHTPADAIPQAAVQGAAVRVLVGEAFGLRSPVATLSPTLYLDLNLAPGQSFDLPMLAQEQALYAVTGSVSLSGEVLPERHLGVLSQASVLQAGPEGCRLVLVGGQPLGHRHIRWNFVSSDPARLDQAGRDWEAGVAEAGMGQVPGETERIPMPPRPGAH
ncbi:pirin family protein [Curvibacter sp. HBC28]|uniref:Pirin family protein n=1 Tax=Curvibacter microcysteis TaxID=3026419 RepID=A0ABT5MGM4_9BURK|nr:pirin family protein [Curvibacter sp. HBC28]MDD0815057.1 pirin family protein [Curvibacter sp. HBC28]